MSPTKREGLPLHVNPTDPAVRKARNDARVRRLRQKLREIGARRRRGESGQAVSDDRIASMMAELERRGGAVQIEDAIPRLRERGLVTGSDEDVAAAVAQVRRSVLLGEDEEQ